MDIATTTKEYKSDSNLVYSCQYHVIFCPKYRRKLLKNGLDLRLRVLVKEKETEYGYKIIEMEIMPDHVHLLMDVNPKLGIFPIIGRIKGYSSRVLRLENPSLDKRMPCIWTRSSFISTVGSVSLEVVKKYIENQKGK